MAWFTFPTVEDLVSWPAPNYVNPITRRPLLLGVEIPLLLLVIFFNAVRFYRIFLLKAMGIDDYMMLVATFCYIANSITMCISTQPQFATGYHMWDLPLDIFVKSAATGSMAMANQLMFIVITAFTKVSILFTYIRLFPSRYNRYFCYTMFAFTAAWAITIFCMTLFQCSPIQAYWLPMQYPNAKCLSVLTLFWTAGILNVISDFLIFLWPATQLAKVQVALKERVTLITMFSLGLIICGAGVLRLWYTPIFAGTYDVLWHGADFYIIVSVETSIGIMCGCLPACRPLMTKILPSLIASFRSWSTGTEKSKKGTQSDGQSFPFESLNDGIVRSKEFSVSYENQDDGDGEGAKRGGVASKRSRADPDNISEGSEEWICYPHGQAVQQAQSAV